MQYTQCIHLSIDDYLDGFQFWLFLTKLVPTLLNKALYGNKLSLFSFILPGGRMAGSSRQVYADKKLKNCFPKVVFIILYPYKQSLSSSCSLPSVTLETVNLLLLSHSSEGVVSPFKIPMLKTLNSHLAPSYQLSLWTFTVNDNHHRQRNNNRATPPPLMEHLSFLTRFVWSTIWGA